MTILSCLLPLTWKRGSQLPMLAARGLATARAQLDYAAAVILSKT